MKTSSNRPIGILAASLVLALSSQAIASERSSEAHDHTQAQAQDHGHDHSHDHDQSDEAHSHADETDRSIYDGYFKDSQVKNRTLSDWEGDWQSVYPYLRDGTLDAVMAQKAEDGEKTADAYKDYYETGYRTDVDRIVIAGDSVTFYKDTDSFEGTYAYDGYEILTYEAGNRGVRYIFEKTGGDAAAPAYIQFSDHRIAPADAGHFHLYWGNDRAALLEEVTNWPTYYPSSLDGPAIVEEMMAH